MAPDLCLHYSLCMNFPNLRNNKFADNPLKASTKSNGSSAFTSRAFSYNFFLAPTLTLAHNQVAKYNDKNL